MHTSLENWFPSDTGAPQRVNQDAVREHYSHNIRNHWIR